MKDDMTIQRLFQMGMKRFVPELLPPVFNHNGGEALNLGAGNSSIAGADSLDLPAWDAERDPIPREDGSVTTIFAFHFFEHLSGVNVIRVLRECERVLAFGGTLNVVVPHRLSQMAFQDIDHKSFWTEETWKILFDNPHYDKNREGMWKLAVHANLIIGIAERNLALMTQLVKTR